MGERLTGQDFMPDVGNPATDGLGRGNQSGFCPKKHPPWLPDGDWVVGGHGDLARRGERRWSQPRCRGEEGGQQWKCLGAGNDGAFTARSAGGRRSVSFIRGSSGLSPVGTQAP